MNYQDDGVRKNQVLDFSEQPLSFREFMELEEENAGLPLDLCFADYYLKYLEFLGVGKKEAEKSLCILVKTYEEYQKEKSKLNTTILFKSVLECVKNSTTKAVEDILILIIATILLAVLVVGIICILYSFLKTDKNKAILAGFAILGMILLLLVIGVGFGAGIRGSTERSKQMDIVCIDEFEELLVKMEIEDKNALATALCKFEEYEVECCEDGTCVSNQF